MEDNQIFAEQEVIIRYVKDALDKIEETTSPNEKERQLYDLLAYLISSSNDIAQKDDFYEAAGRLYSAAYYLEQMHLDQADEIYQQVIKYYYQYYRILIQQGSLMDAANVLIKVASIYKNKLHEVENYQKYLYQGIELISQSLQKIEEEGDLREICGKQQILAMLYEKLEKWSDVLFYANKSLEIAKKIKDYSIIANSYNDIFRSVSILADLDKADNVLYEAVDYFLKEAEYCEIQEKYILLAQIYQIVKNIFQKLDDVVKFEKYARKEAGVYLSLASQGSKDHIENVQIASYYRGAALCYFEIKGNAIDSASCFVLSAHYYQKAKKFNEAAINYEDAAKLFEDILKYEKAWEFYKIASSCALRMEDFEFAILNLMNAETMGEKLKLEMRGLYFQIQNLLTDYAQIHHEKRNFFISGTLYLEAAEYISKISPISLAKIHELLNSALEEYWALYIDEGFNKCPDFSVYYVCSLILILSKILPNFNFTEINNSVNNLISNQNKNKNNPKKASLETVKIYLEKHAPDKYLDLTSAMLATIASQKPQKKSFFIKNTQIFREHGIAEVQKLHDLIIKHPQILKYIPPKSF